MTKAVSALNISDRRHTDCFRFFARETQLKHELAKFSLYVELRMQGHTVYVEPTFYNMRGRPDILDITTQTVWEILNTEKKEDFELKKNYYPDFFKVNSISADKLIEQLKKLIENLK
jgi:thymidylate synthase